MDLDTTIVVMKKAKSGRSAEGNTIHIDTDEYLELEDVLTFNVATDEKVQTVYFQVKEVEAAAEYVDKVGGQYVADRLLVKAVQIGYLKFDFKGIDPRSIVGITPDVVTDQETLKKLQRESTYC